MAKKARKVSRRRRFFMRRNNGGGRRKFTLPLAIIGGFASPVVRSVGAFQANGLTGPEGAVAEFTRTMIGVNPYSNPIKFEWQRLKYGLLPVMLGIGVHKVANWVGINRALARAGVPVVRI